MNTEVSLPSIVVKDTGTAKGRGVFAARDFQAGEVVEVSPVILINMAFIFLPNELKTVVFNWPSGEPNIHAVALGYGSLYNHDDPANMHTRKDHQNKQLFFIASRNIVAGEELTHNYNSNLDNPASNDWFERHNVPLITRQKPD